MPEQGHLSELKDVLRHVVRLMTYVVCCLYQRFPSVLFVCVPWPKMLFLNVWQPLPFNLLWCIFLPVGSSSLFYFFAIRCLFCSTSWSTQLIDRYITFITLASTITHITHQLAALHEQHSLRLSVVGRSWDELIKTMQAERERHEWELFIESIALSE